MAGSRMAMSKTGLNSPIKYGASVLCLAHHHMWGLVSHTGIIGINRHILLLIREQEPLKAAPVHPQQAETIVIPSLWALPSYWPLSEIGKEKSEACCFFPNPSKITSTSDDGYLLPKKLLQYTTHFCLFCHGNYFLSEFPSPKVLPSS